jgi:hypothetical protein
VRYIQIKTQLNSSIPDFKIGIKLCSIDICYNKFSRKCAGCPIFPELRPILDEAFEIFGDCRGSLRGPALDFGEIHNTMAVISEKSPTMGWKNANLRSEMTRLLRRAGVSGWPRLFHSMRASRQTELQREFPLHVVCSWLGNSPRIAQQSYLLVTEDDFAKAAGAKTVTTYRTIVPERTHMMEPAPPCISDPASEMLCDPSHSSTAFHISPDCSDKSIRNKSVIKFGCLPFHSAITPLESSWSCKQSA